MKVKAKTTSSIPTTPIANVDANKFRAAYLCVSKEETRYYLNGVYITPHKDGGALLVATDGHRMIVIHDKEAWCRESAIVQIDKAGLEACKPRKGIGTLAKETIVPRLVVDEDGKAEIEGVWRSPGKVLIDGVYPDWRRVLPFKAKFQHAVASFNPKLIAQFGEIAAILSMASEPTKAIRIETDGIADPALIHLGEIAYALGVLMPMRSSESLGFPKWLDPIRAEVEAERSAALKAEADAARKKADEATKAAVKSERRAKAAQHRAKAKRVTKVRRKAA